MSNLQKFLLITVLSLLVSCKPSEILGEAFTQKRKLGAVELKVYKKDDLLKELEVIETRRRGNIKELAIEFNKADWKSLTENYNKAKLSAQKGVVGPSVDKWLKEQLGFMAMAAKYQQEQLSLIDYKKVGKLSQSFDSDRFYWDEVKVSQLKPNESSTTDADGKFVLKAGKEGLLLGRSADGDLFWLIDLSKVEGPLQLTEFNTLRSRCNACGLDREDFGGDDFKRLKEISSTFTLMRERQLGIFTGLGSEIFTDELLLNEYKSKGISDILIRLIN